jgi:hypothetical protein
MVFFIGGKIGVHRIPKWNMLPHKVHAEIFNEKSVEIPKPDHWFLYFISGK